MQACWAGRGTGAGAVDWLPPAPARPRPLTRLRQVLRTHVNLPRPFGQSYVFRCKLGSRFLPALQDCVTGREPRSTPAQKAETEVLRLRRGESVADSPKRSRKRWGPVCVCSSSVPAAPVACVLPVTQTGIRLSQGDNQRWARSFDKVLGRGRRPGGVIGLAGSEGSTSTLGRAPAWQRGSCYSGLHDCSRSPQPSIWLDWSLRNFPQRPIIFSVESDLCHSSFLILQLKTLLLPPILCNYNQNPALQNSAGVKLPSFIHSDLGVLLLATAK